MDVHVPLAITRRLRSLGFDVLTAQEDGAHLLADPVLLDRITELGRILFTQDEDFLVEASRRFHEGIEFATIVYGHQFHPIGRIVADLKLILEIAAPNDVRNQVLRVPLR